MSRLDLPSVAALADVLHTTVPQLQNELRRADDSYRELALIDPKKPGKVRAVVSARGVIRFWQGRFYRTILLPSLVRSPHSQGASRNATF